MHANCGTSDPSPMFALYLGGPGIKSPSMFYIMSRGGLQLMAQWLAQRAAGCVLKLHVADGLASRPVPQHSFNYSVVRLTTGPQPIPKRVLRRVHCTVSPFKFQYILVSSRSSSTCLRLLPRLPVTSIFVSIFPLITCFRMQFLLYM